MNKRILVTYAAIFSAVLLLGCGTRGSPSASRTVQETLGASVVTGETATLQGRTWYTDGPNKGLTMAIHMTFSAGGRTYSTDSGAWGAYLIDLPSSAGPGMRYTIHATAEGYQSYDGEVTVVTGADNVKEIELAVIKK